MAFDRARIWKPNLTPASTAGLAGVAASLSIVWTTRGHGYFSFEWLTAKAVLTGIDPHLPLGQLADAFGLSNPLTYAHPRLPGALLLQSPFGLIPFENVYTFGRLITLLAGLWFVWLLCRWIGVSPGWGFLVFPIALAYGPARAALETGQYSAFLVAGLIGITLLASEDRYQVGIPLGVAITFKLWPWLIVPALWLADRRKSALGAAGAFAALNGTGLFLPSVSVERTLFALNSVADHWSQSILDSLGLPVWVSVATGLALLMAVHLMGSHGMLLITAVPISLLVAPILWSAYLPALAVPIVQIWRARPTPMTQSEAETV